MSEKWIDVNDNEKPPVTIFKDGYIDPKKTVIIWIDFGDGDTDCVTGWWTGEKFMERDGGRGSLWEIFNATHWQLIPLAPEETPIQKDGEVNDE